MEVKDGIILTGGTGSRLRPLTNVVNKHLIPINGKFIIDYPINTLKEIGCENITVILGSNHSGQIIDYLKDGADFGVNISYVYQSKPSGISQAISLCERFVKDKFAVMLGDNIYGTSIKLKESKKAQIVLCSHKELKRFGVASIDKNGKIIKIEEKPLNLDCSVNNFAITGTYIFDSLFFEYFKQTSKSARGEFEIVDIIRKYLDNGNLDYSIINSSWVDAGTHEAVEYASKHMLK